MMVKNKQRCCFSQCRLSTWDSGTTSGPLHFCPDQDGTIRGFGVQHSHPRLPQDLENLLDIQLGDEGPHHDADHKEKVDYIPEAGG